MTTIRKDFEKGIRLRSTTDSLTRDGELSHDSADNKLKVRLNADTKEIITDDQTQTLTNKTIDADNNTISNLEVDNLKAGVLDTDLTSVSASDDTLPSAKAVKTYVDAQIATVNEASEISYDNATSGLTATNVQDAIDELADEKLDAALPSANIFVGDGTNVAQAQAVTGDISINNTGVTAINTGVIVNADINASAAIDATKIADGSVDNTEFQYLNGVTSSIQTQIDSKVTGPASATDNAITRYDGTTGKLVQNSGVTIDDTNVVSGATQLNVDNLRLDGNTISSTDVNGDISLTPNGTGEVNIPKVDIDSGTINSVDLDGGTASNTSRVTIPKDTKANLDALTRKEGTIVYATDEDKLYVDDGTNLIAVGSSSGLNVVTKTTTATLMTTGEEIVLADASGGSFTITLPTAVGNSGLVYRIVKIAGNELQIVTIDGDGSETIDGNATQQLISTTDSIIIVSNGTAWFSISKDLRPKVAYIKDVKASGTDGGTFTSGAFQTRVLNNLSGDNIVSLSSNQFTPEAGTYFITAYATGFRVGAHKAKIRNVTDSVDALIGSTSFSSSNLTDINNEVTGDVTMSIITGPIVTDGTKAYELQHRCQNTLASLGFGTSSSFGVSEVYSQVILVKLG